MNSEHSPVFLSAANITFRAAEEGGPESGGGVHLRGRGRRILPPQMAAGLLGLTLLFSFLCLCLPEDMTHSSHSVP